MINYEDGTIEELLEDINDDISKHMYVIRTNCTDRDARLANIGIEQHIRTLMAICSGLGASLESKKVYVDRLEKLNDKLLGTLKSSTSAEVK